MGTHDCQKFVSSHYGLMNFITEPEDWVLEKKYKNFHLLTCRDFINSKLNLKAIVIMSNINSDLSVIENANYQFFLKDRNKKLFYYVPIISNKGLSYYFSKKDLLDKNLKLTKLSNKDQELLTRSLKLAFRSEDIINIEKEMLVDFPKINVEVVMKKLEANHFSYNPKLFEVMDMKKYKPFYPDLSANMYSCPDDSGFEQEESITRLFNLCSQNKIFKIEYYAQISLLLKKVSLEEILIVSKIMLGFINKEDLKLNEIVVQEINIKNKESIFSKKRKNDNES